MDNTEYKYKKAILALADGTVFEGQSLGSPGESAGELCFNTSMTGYQEILTDPSYKGQIVTMTYTQIGNYGLNSQDVESRRPWLEGFVVKEACSVPSSWRSEGTLHDYLLKNAIVGISGIDTRALTKRLRERGAMEAVISTLDMDPTSLVTKARGVAPLVGRDLVKEVTTDKTYQWDKPLWTIDNQDDATEVAVGDGRRFKVLVYDFGIKTNILRSLVSLGCDLTVVPAHTTAEDLLRLTPDGVFLSNGPGDPEALTYAIDNIRSLIGKVPIFGICLGHQIISLALGARSYKLKFGHRGANHPVMNKATGRVEITSQNHGFAIDPVSLKGDVMATHINLNDNTLEGLESVSHKLFSVQYHPESSPGPHDSSYLFDKFITMMKG